MRYEVRPLEVWTDPETNPRRGSHVFKASWRDTLDLLGDEVEKLGGSLVVMQIDVREGDIRLDGMVRANAKVGHPGVAISFESKFGPLRYATDAHERQYGFAKLDGWQANVRAIALSLTALRAVDRYGVTRRGEQYTGWKAIEAPKAEFATADAAAEWMRKYADDALKLGEFPTFGALYRAMAKLMHPDKGAPRADWDRLDEARRVLTEARMF